MYFPSLHRPTFLRLTAKARSSSAAFSKMWPVQNCLAAWFFCRSSHVFESWKTYPFCEIHCYRNGSNIFSVSTLILNWPLKNRKTITERRSNNISVMALWRNFSDSISNCAFVVSASGCGQTQPLATTQRGKCRHHVGSTFSENNLKGI